MSLDEGTICPYKEAMTTPNWDLIDQAAAALQVSAPARKKWRQRKAVPHKWRLPLIKQTNGKLTVFEETPESEMESVA